MTKAFKNYLPLIAVLGLVQMDARAEPGRVNKDAGCKKVQLDKKGQGTLESVIQQNRQKTIGVCGNAATAPSAPKGSSQGTEFVKNKYSKEMAPAEKSCKELSQAISIGGARSAFPAEFDKLKQKLWATAGKNCDLQSNLIKGTEDSCSNYIDPTFKPTEAKGNFQTAATNFEIARDLSGRLSASLAKLKTDPKSAPLKDGIKPYAASSHAIRESVKGLLSKVKEYQTAQKDPARAHSLEQLRKDSIKGPAFLSQFQAAKIKHERVQKNLQPCLAIQKNFDKIDKDMSGLYKQFEGMHGEVAKAQGWAKATSDVSGDAAIGNRILDRDIGQGSAPESQSWKSLTPNQRKTPLPGATADNLKFPGYQPWSAMAQCTKPCDSAINAAGYCTSKCN